MKLGLKNFMTLTIVAIVGITLMKVAFTKVNVPGVSEIVNAV